jgi:signal peptidase II
VIVWILIIAGVVLLDQLSKWLVVEFLSRETPFVIIEGILRFKYSENRGAAFGSFDEQRWVFMIASIVGIIGMSIYLFKFSPKSKLACTALSMIVGGGIGNMIDRTFRTGEIYEGEKVVVDFIDFYPFPDLWNAIFNVADSFVCVGAALLILWCIISTVQETKAEKLAKAQKTSEAAEPAAENAPEEEKDKDAEDRNS